MPPQERGHTPETIIQGFKDDFQRFLKENPDVVEVLKKDILAAGGLSEMELIDEEMGYDFGLVKVPVEALDSFGTSCGYVDNTALSGEARDFLRARGVEFILGVCNNKTFVLGAAAIKIGQRDGVRLERIIEKNHGSFRRDSSKVDGWTIYESE